MRTFHRMLSPLARLVLLVTLALALALALPSPARAAAMSDYLENKVVDWLFRAQAFTPPSALYVSLHTAACSDSSTGTEVTGGSYARAQLDPSTTNWANTQDSGTGVSSGTTGTTKNKATITFPSPTANWGSVTHFAVFDASSAGNMLFCAALGTAKTVNNGDAAPSFAVDALTIQVDN